ncbi:hypothetical protein [Rhizosphaericola mali]|uniref:hypothetical protein n=1 Tax=Rhizosphaericola mali TaxID=2545455 RepID=UPI0017809E62|nr:hypothetical protein [Rhizosphaericola mali]
MKKQIIAMSFLVLTMMSLSGCQVVGTIFKAGMWWGIIMVVIVIVAIIWLISKFSGKK